MRLRSIFFPILLISLVELIKAMVEDDPDSPIVICRQGESQFKTKEELIWEDCVENILELIPFRSFPSKEKSESGYKNAMVCMIKIPRITGQYADIFIEFWGNFDDSLSVSDSFGRIQSIHSGPSRLTTGIDLLINLSTVKSNRTRSFSVNYVTRSLASSRHHHKEKKSIKDLRPGQSLHVNRSLFGNNTSSLVITSSSPLVVKTIGNPRSHNGQTHSVYLFKGNSLKGPYIGAIDDGKTAEFLIDDAPYAVTISKTNSKSDIAIVYSRLVLSNDD